MTNTSRPAFAFTPGQTYTVTTVNDLGEQWVNAGITFDHGITDRDFTRGQFLCFHSGTGRNRRKYAMPENTIVAVEPA
jgi:hypothetical protein